MDGMLAQLKRLESAPALAKQRFHFRRIFKKAVPQEHTQPRQLLRRAAVPQIPAHSAEVGGGGCR